MVYVADAIVAWVRTMKGRPTAPENAPSPGGDTSPGTTSPAGEALAAIRAHGNELFNSSRLQCASCHTRRRLLLEKKTTMGDTRALTKEDRDALEAYLRTL